MHRRSIRRALALAALVPLLAAPAAAQVRSFRLALDNDAYNFWEPLRERPDHEYTNGVHAALEVAGGPGWARRLAPGAARCTGGEDADAPCTATTFALGQKIFTPRVDTETLRPGERPYAGWLYLSATGRLQSREHRRSLGVELGVTGPPSLGEAVHRTWHRITGFWNPEGWRNQIGFEPGVAVRYDEAVTVEVRTGGVRLAALTPEWGAAAGNVHTGAHVGLRATAGYAVPHPWSAAADRGAPRLSAYALAGTRQDAVAHSLFLDGNTFGHGLRVERRPFVFRYELGGGVRYGRATLEYRAVARDREYETEPGGHTYSTLELAYRLR